MHTKNCKRDTQFWWVIVTGYIFQAENGPTFIKKSNQKQHDYSKLSDPWKKIMTLAYNGPLNIMKQKNSDVEKGS